MIINKSNWLVIYKGEETNIIRVSVLGSGSAGNSIYLESSYTKILIDAGFNGKEIARRLRIIGRRIEELDALLITHEHIDHTRGGGSLARRYGIPVYLNPDTHRAALAILGELPRVEYFNPGSSFPLQDLVIEPFYLPHDASNPNGFNIYEGETKVSIALDLGYITNLVRERFQQARLVILESNHDPELLQLGPYPWSLKQRISSKLGHLSNQLSGKLLAEVTHSGLEGIILVHVSQINNDPTLIRIAIEKSLRHSPPKLVIACQDKPTQLLTINGH